jgi:pyrimidine operon attenuation protein/uracil phosphoribosyltransferase
MALKENCILDYEGINHKAKRIAYQIYESNVEAKEVVIAGIDLNGYLFAKMIERSLINICDLVPILCNVKIDKKNPENPITTSLSSEEYLGKSLVLVDDVLNSGATLIYGVKHFLDVPLKQFKTAVLVNRNHKKYPVKADYKGISLSTSIKEHVSVIFEGKGSKVVMG